MTLDDLERDVDRQCKALRRRGQRPSTDAIVSPLPVWEVAALVLDERRRWDVVTGLFAAIGVRKGRR